MADFCTKCAIQLEHKTPEIDVDKIFEDLEEGFSYSGGLCEGCGLVSISKIKGELKVMRIGKGLSEWENY